MQIKNKIIFFKVSIFQMLFQIFLHFEKNFIQGKK